MIFWIYIEALLYTNYYYFAIFNCEWHWMHISQQVHLVLSLKERKKKKKKIPFWLQFPNIWYLLFKKKKKEILFFALFLSYPGKFYAAARAKKRKNDSASKVLPKTLPFCPCMIMCFLHKSSLIKMHQFDSSSSARWFSLLHSRSC